jgi:hypothetical protein
MNIKKKSVIYVWVVLILTFPMVQPDFWNSSEWRRYKWNWHPSWKGKKRRRYKIVKLTRCIWISVGIMLCRGKKCMFYRDKELIGCQRQNVEAGRDFSLAHFNRNKRPKFRQDFPNHFIWLGPEIRKRVKLQRISLRLRSSIPSIKITVCTRL